MPANFALADKVIGNPTMGLFAAFGSFAMLLLVDFMGAMRDRLLSQAALGVVCALLICLATLASRKPWLAAVAMTVVGFAILFSGVLSSVVAAATMTLLLAFILPVTVPGSASSIPDRIAGWGLAAAVSLVAIRFLWPAPVRQPVRVAAITASRALAARLRAELARVAEPDDPGLAEALDAAVAAADDAIDEMRSTFYATRFRPSRLTTEARAVIRVIEELQWISTIVLRRIPQQHWTLSPAARAAKLDAAEVLERSADTLESPDAPIDALRDAEARLEAALQELRDSTVEVAPTHEPVDRVVTALDPSFRAQQLGFVVGQVAGNAEFAATAARRSWLDRMLGRQPEGAAGPLTAVQMRAAAHATRQSLWLRNSLRGAVALGVSVFVADSSSLQHGFWVVFGTLSVLRSNALSTGEDIVRAVLGTTIGFLIGGALVYLIGTDTPVLWALLPFAILLAGFAPAAISFAAGQAAFTLTLLILFNIIAPAGWKVGLFRIEDVAIGGAVSLLVGIVFWPRGAAATLGSALAEAYARNAEYLEAAVAYGGACCDSSGPRPVAPRDRAMEAWAASARLDDTFRGYLTEQGPKSMPLADVSALVTGASGVRLVADAVLDLWDESGVTTDERSTARRVLMSTAANITQWYEHFGASLAGSEQIPPPLAHDEAIDRRLVAAVERDLSGGDGRSTAAGVRVIWTGDHLDAARRLQSTLVAPARIAVSQS